MIVIDSFKYNICMERIYKIERGFGYMRIEVLQYVIRMYDYDRYKQTIIDIDIIINSLDELKKVIQNEQTR